MNYYMNIYKMDENDKNIEVFRWHEREYQKVVTDYQTTIDEMKKYLEQASFRMDLFKKALREIQNGQATLEYMANDWSCPIILIKYFLKNEI